jgi:competence ComEA-like helix-hairpin-helix protein
MRHTTLVLLAFVLVMLGVTGVAALRRPVDRDRLAPQAVGFLVDVNSADAPTLALLPDIGPALARRIIEERERRGPFQSVGDLLRVSGIGPKKLDAMRPYVAARAPAIQP